MRTVVSPSGVYVCPYHRGNLNMRIGDINKKSFEEVWFGNQRKEVMEKLDPKKHCGFHCIRDGSNKYLRELIDGKKKRILQKSQSTTDLSKEEIINFLKTKIKNLPSKNFTKIDLFENSYLDSLKFLILLNEIEKKFKIKIQFDNKTNLWIRTIDSLARKIFNLKKK